MRTALIVFSQARGLEFMLFGTMKLATLRSNFFCEGDRAFQSLNWNCGMHFPEVSNISNAEGTYTTESQDEISDSVYLNH